MTIPENETVAGEEKNENPLDLNGRKWTADVEDEIDSAILADIEREEKENKKPEDNEDEDYDEEDTEEDSTDSDDDNSDASDSDSDSVNDEDNEDEDGDDADSDDSDDSDGDNGADEDDNESDESLIEDRAKKLAEKYDVDIDIAREEAKADKAIADKYESNPMEIAHALRSMQGEFTRVNQAMLEAQKESSNPYQFGKDSVRIIDPKTGKVSELSKEEFVEKYKEKLGSKDSELQDMGVDEVYREARRRNKEWLNARFNQARSEIKKAASTVREDIIKNIPESLLDYKGHLKKLVENFPDETLASADFNKDLPIKLIKGEYIDEIIKKKEKEAYERGQKNARLIKDKKKSPTNMGKSAKTGKTYRSLLNKRQQSEALDQYEDDNISDELKYKYYYQSIKKK